MQDSTNLRIVLVAIIVAVFTLHAAAQESFEAQPLERLFSVPSGRVLKTMEVALTLGGAYGSMNKGEYLGIASVGLGSVAELEVSTWRVVSNIFTGTTALGTTAIKVAVLTEGSNPVFPSVTVAFRLNPSWASLEFSGSDLSEEIRDDVDEVKFETHTASLYVNVSKELTKSISLHGGLFLTDVRTRSGSAILAGGLSSGPIPDMNEDHIGGFIGFVRQVNPRTFVMGEACSIPRYKYIPSNNQLEVDQVALIIAGFRFYFAKRISTDAGVKYRTDYEGIADAEISVGLNVGFNVQEVFTRISQR